MKSSKAVSPGKATRRITIQQEQELIEQAIALLECRMFKRGAQISNPEDIKKLMRLKLARYKNEVFAVFFLDSKQRFLAFEELFRGSVDTASVYPRVVLQRALHHNAAAVVLFHNHPSGVTDPSLADKALTLKLKELLAQIDVRVIDHFIVGLGEPYSFVEAGLM
ncbi:TPA: JAB domain-containing protein [Pseudomonas aeruginosa]